MGATSSSTPTSATRCSWREPVPRDLDRAQHEACVYAMRVTSKFGSWRTAEDLFQDAALAVLTAPVDAARTTDELAHYLCRRATGAVIDSMRREMSQNLRPRHGDGLQRLDDGDDAIGHLQAVDGDPEVAYECSQLARRIARMREPRPQVAAMLAQGFKAVEIAEELGVGASYISMLRREIRDTVEAEAINDMQAHLFRRALMEQ